jgi:hypothetical protein
MGSFSLKQVSGAVYNIVHDRAKVGSVVKSSPDGKFKGDWVANMEAVRGRKLQAIDRTVSGAFQEVVAQDNRLALGVAKDDHAGAVKALAELNRKIEARNAAQRAAEAPIMDGFREIFAKHGIPLPPPRRPRYKKVAI